jgi:hypothetical protein
MPESARLTGHHVPDLTRPGRAERERAGKAKRACFACVQFGNAVYRDR